MQKPAAVAFIGMLLSGFLWPFELPSVSADIQVANTLHSISVNSNTGKLYFANDNGSVSVVDSRNKAEILKIWLPGSADPEIEYFRSSVAINEITNKIYASSSVAELLVVIDGKTDQIVKEIPLDQFMDVFSIGVNPLTNRVYAATYSFVYVIDGSTDEIIERIDIGDHTFMGGDTGGLWPAELSVNPKTNLIYATNSGKDLIAVIDGTVNRVIANITVPSPFSAVINPISNKLYVTFQSGDYIAAYNGAYPYERLIIIDDVDTQSFSNDQIAIDAERNRVYVIAYPEDGVTIIDGSLDKKLETVVTHIIPVALGVNPATGIVYVGMDGYSIVGEIENSGATPQVTDAIEIQTDQQTYGLNQTVIITGKVPKTEGVPPDQNVVILEFGNTKDGAAYFVDVASLSEDGSFSYVIQPEQLRTTSLTQTVRAVYYCNTPAEAWFNFTSSYVRPELPGATWRTIPAIIAGEEYLVDYAISGGSLLRIDEDIELATITISLDTFSDGKVILEFPKRLNEFLGFFPLVFVDSIPGEVKLLHIGEDITALEVEFENGTEEIELVGQFMPGSKPTFTLPPYEQFPKSFTTKNYANVSGEDFFIWVHVNGADTCVSSFSQENKNVRIELTGKDSSEGSLTLYLPIRLFSGNFSVFIDGKEQLNTFIQKEPAGITYGGRDNSITILTQPFNWSNPEATGTISIDVYASRVLPEFNTLVVAILLVTSVIGVIILTRSVSGTFGSDSH